MDPSLTSFNSTDPESAPQSVQWSAEEDEVITIENEPAANTPSIDLPNRKTTTQLSTVSRMYDMNNDGELDDAEKAMRTMDQSGRGYLTNDKVYAMMLEQLETQKKLFRMKRIVFVLLALVVILALANLGTSFAAASLAKDTAVSSSAGLVDKKTNEALSTQTTSESLTIERAIITSDGRRKLCNVDGEANDAECDLSDGNWVISMNKNKCRKMRNQCKKGNTVRLLRTWGNGDESYFSVCPYTGTLSRDNRSEMTNNFGKKFTFEEIAEGHCVIEGEAVTMPEGGICEVTPDCASGLSCTILQSFVDTCKQRCGYRRWTQLLVEQCQAGCDHPSCQATDAVE